MPSPTLPPGACDTHVHVFRPDIYPYAASRAYTPARITAGDLAGFLDAHGLTRVVIVQPSVYGTDNRAVLDALADLGSRARGIAVIDLETATDAELQDLEKAGVRGIRLNVATRQEEGLAEAVTRAAAQLSGSNWAIQIYAPLAGIVAAAPVLHRLRQPLILDHFGGARTAGPDLPAGTDVLIDLAGNGPAYIKLSAAYRASDGRAPGWPDVAPLARRLVDTVPDRLVWGSDWPHTGSGREGRPPDEVEPFQEIDDHLALARLARERHVLRVAFDDDADAAEDVEHRSRQLLDAQRLGDMTAALQILVAQQCDEFGVGEVIRPGEADQDAQGFFRMADVECELRFGRTQLGVDALQHLDVKAFLAREVVIDHAVARACQPRNALDPRAAVAVAHELIARRAQDARARLVGVASGGGLTRHALCNRCVAC